MSSEVVPAVGPKLHRFYTWFDVESAAVATILLGLVQVLLSVVLVYADAALPKFFILPLILGAIIVAGGSFTMASERFPNIRLLQGCACSNVVGLLGAVLSFCLYCYGLTILPKKPCANFRFASHSRRFVVHECPEEVLVAYTWCVMLLLLVFDSLAVVLHCFLSLSALKALKTD